MPQRSKKTMSISEFARSHDLDQPGARGVVALLVANGLIEEMPIDKENRNRGPKAKRYKFPAQVTLRLF